MTGEEYPGREDPRTIRLVQAMAGARHGGAERFFERLCLAMERSGVVQRAIIRADADRRARLRAGGVRVEELPFGGPLDFRTGRRFRSLVDAFDPDIVLTYMTRATRYCSATATGRGHRFLHVGRLGGYYRVDRYRKCDYLVVNTRDLIAHCVAGGFPADRVRHLPNFVEEVPAIRPVSRAREDTPADVPVLLALGRLHRNKAFDVLIEALASVPRAVLWLAGSGPEGPALRSLAERAGVAGRIRFLGWRQDTTALMAAADLVVVSARHEPLGNVILEAFAQAKPVVAAASQGPRELICDGENGLLVPVDDSAALAAAVGRALGDPAAARTMAAAGRAMFEREFSEPVVVGKYLAFFEEIVSMRQAETNR